MQDICPLGLLQDDYSYAPITRPFHACNRSLRAYYNDIDQFSTKLKAVRFKKRQLRQNCGKKSRKIRREEKVQEVFENRKEIGFQLLSSSSLSSSSLSSSSSSSSTSSASEPFLKNRRWATSRPKTLIVTIFSGFPVAQNRFIFHQEKIFIKMQKNVISCQTFLTN